MPTTHDIFVAFMRAGTRQIATTAEGKRIVVAGLGAEIHDLLEHVAAPTADDVLTTFTRVAAREIVATAHDVFSAFLRTATRQLETTAAERIISAGLRAELQSLIEQVAANAANPIANQFEDAIGCAG